MKIHKRILISIIAIFAALALFIALCGIWLSDRYINGFTGMRGIVQLTFGNDYVILTNEPLQVLIRPNDFCLALDNFFETFISGGHFGHGYNEGIRYHVVTRVFMRHYWIATIYSKSSSN